MLPIDDPQWKTYKGGYRVVYDASRAIKQLFTNGPDKELWAELWNELHHQGDIDQASYASVPWLIEYLRSTTKLDWNPLALIATIELARDKCNNPPINPELISGYYAAMELLPELLVTHPDREWNDQVMQSAAACIAAARGQRWFAQAYFELDRETAANWFSEEFGWGFLTTE